ncbi:polysaccharide biosynthesis C-terminal domain-containing protein [Rhodanobacter sp. C03]|uniref:oligosaccharide flippase family protein n=1 Tax=Rhodanobacter sp. C03 TaxID=1945858 RepID=UPI0009863058|nr:polysaccharide biosynthesis C-terminal domain-containing protein [Rhodanobacter sp. C03]OOG53670.1 polysaccharide biosynthesis protein [Rhodanobacter sp. C03]
MSTRDSTLRNTLFSSIGIYTEYFLGMVAAIMIARHLGPTDYGIYGLFIWFASVGVVVTNSGIANGVIKFVAELRGIGREDLIVPLLGRLRRAQVWHMALVAIAAAFLFLVARKRVAGDLGPIDFCLLLFAVGMRAPYMFNIAIAKGFEAFDATAKVALVAAPVNLAMVIAASLLHASISWFLVVYAASSALFLLASQFQARRLLRKLPSPGCPTDELIRRMRRHLRIISLTIIVSFLVASDVEILFLNLYASSTSAGYFKVAYQLATGIMLLVPGVFGALLLPMMAKALSQSLDVAGQRFVDATSYLLLLAAPVLGFGIAFSGTIIGILYGGVYATAAPVFAWCLFAGAVTTVSQSAISLLVSADRQHTILIMTISFGIMKFLLDMTLIRHFGLYGAIAAIVLVTLASSTSYLTISMRAGGVHLAWMRLLRTMLAAALASLLASLVVRLQMPPIFTLLLGGLVLTVVYFLLTLCIGCWSAADLAQLQGLHQRFASGRPRWVGQMLSWFGARARRGS